MAIVECGKCGKPYSEWAPECPYCSEGEKSVAVNAEPRETPAGKPVPKRRQKLDATRIVLVISLLLLSLSILSNVYLLSRVERLTDVIRRMEIQEEKLIRMLEKEPP